MNPKNRFKQKVVKQAVAQGVKHQEATKQVEASFHFYPSQEWEAFDHCDGYDCLCGNHTHMTYQAEAYGAKVGKWSFGGDEYGDGNQMWPTATNDGSIAATAHIQKMD